MKKKGVFIRKFLGTLHASLLGNLLIGKGTIRAGEDTIGVGQFFYAASSFKKL